MSNNMQHSWTALLDTESGCQHFPGTLDTLDVRAQPERQSNLHFFLYTAQTLGIGIGCLTEENNMYYMILNHSVVIMNEIYTVIKYSYVEFVLALNRKDSTLIIQLVCALFVGQKLISVFVSGGRKKSPCVFCIKAARHGKPIKATVLDFAIV